MPFLAPKLDPLPALDFTNQTVLVTGTTNGLGLAVSKELLRLRASRLIMGVRDVRRGLETRELLQCDPSIRAVNPQAQIHVLKLDLEDYTSVAAFTKEVESLAKSIDVVILNAGVGGLQREMTKSGHEKIIQVNVLSNALLAMQLLPLLRKSAELKGSPSRLTWVGSFVQEDHGLTKKPIPFDSTVLGHFDDEKNFVGLSRYSDSKLLSTCFVKELATHVDKKMVIVNEVSPGPVLTNFGAKYPLLLRVVFTAALALRARSLEAGANTYLHAVAVAGEESHGEYLSDGKISTRAKIVETPEGSRLQKKLWEEVMDECRRVNDRIMED
ncbi:hypothetical protein B0I35DRAFT_483960 [Stachybotrys elegans]|uniref:Ketoreductase (KR) domain-containing protein n=1 Tax=Stachybotrys elegans TaxID=80388 RepID=A0A8K0SJU2_9HYPO|nr:hypothetical protein B0I35DRAFT_483960 [Stachybotrys elegans]